MFANVGSAGATDSAGNWGFGATVNATTTYRVSLPRYHQFAHRLVLGVVTGIDKTPASVSKAKLTAKKLTFTITEPGTIKVTLKLRGHHKSHGKTVATYKKVKAFTIKATKAGVVSTPLKTLKAGAYKVTRYHVDLSNNVKSRTADPQGARDQDQERV